VTSDRGNKDTWREVPLCDDTCVQVLKTHGGKNHAFYRPQEIYKDLCEKLRALTVLIL